MDNKYTVSPPKVITDLRHLVKSSADKWGDKDLYLYKHQKEDRHYSYNDLYHTMNYLGTAFSKIGLMGETVAVIGDTHPSWITTYLATVNGGGVIIPLDKEVNDEQIINFVNNSEAKAIVYTEGFNNKLVHFAEKMPNVRHFIPIMGNTETVQDKVYFYDDLVALGKAEMEQGNTTYTNHKIDMEKLCAILFTSGTTGTSKGVMLSQHNLTAATNASCLSMSYDYRNTFVSVLPAHHSYEITCGHFAILNLGATILINDSLKYALRNFQTFKPNALMLVPLFVETMHKKIWDEIGKKGMTKKVKMAMKLSDFLRKIGIDKRKQFFGQITDALGGNLESIVCGGAPLNPQLTKNFKSFGIDIFEGYGITECAPLVAVNRPNQVRYHSVGTPVVGCEVKIEKQPTEETGEILVKGENVMMGYYRNEEATKAVFTEDGWFRTGDIGYIDKSGYIYITGRKKNVIILSNGKNVFPEEIEEYLAQCETIAECIVVGRAKEGSEPVITAIVYPNYEKLKGKTDDEVMNAVKAEVNPINRSLPSFKQVHGIEIRKTEFEKTTSKKIKRYTV